jgi:hypothetical protein
MSCERMAGVVMDDAVPTIYLDLEAQWRDLARSMLPSLFTSGENSRPWSDEGVGRPTVHATACPPDREVGGMAISSTGSGPPRASAYAVKPAHELASLGAS